MGLNVSMIGMAGARAAQAEWANRAGVRPVARSLGKRGFDVTVALVGLIFFLPLLLAVAVAIRLESDGPVLFRQRRTGLGGKVFAIFKFRTMTVTEDCADLRQATRQDGRVTAVGAVLRRLSIDELPQLLNVLAGDMSLVGPRPHALAHDQAYAAMVTSYAQRFRARPGLTGYAQVHGLRGEVRRPACMTDRVAADNLYIDRWSFSMDLAILVRTIPLVFRDPRAY